MLGFSIVLRLSNALAAVVVVSLFTLKMSYFPFSYFSNSVI